MTLYIEDDNHVDPCPPAKCTRPLLRFRHNIEESIVIHPIWSFDKNVVHLIKTKNYERSYVDDVDFYGRVLVPLVCKKRYTGTTATLFAPSGQFLCDGFSHLHPEDQFCKLTGRQVAQDRLITYLNDSRPVMIDSLTRQIIIEKLTNNTTAHPLNW